MAYIIAHGTVNGYNKVYQPTNCGSELQVITDIRAEFDNTSTMLEKPMGYLIQMSSNGVWVSVVKLLFDGERSGNGPGFFAFSAFIPSQQVVDGGVLKHSLDKLMNDYLTQLSREYFTQNIGIDWSFVEQASKELDSQCKHRTKTINTNYTQSDKFAFINIEKDELVVKYLDKPFQPEYGAFRAVFFGTYLQNPNRRSTYTQLSIDIENEVYDIIWLGDTSDYPAIPKTIRKNQINTYLTFPKKHYQSKEILLSEGVVDDVNATVTVHVPQLDPISYSFKLIINHPEAVKSITAASNTSKAPLLSSDNETLEFMGEQVDMQWRISIHTHENWLTKELEIVPSDYIDNGSMKGEFGISLVELKLINIQIYIDGYEDTKGQQQKIQIINRNTNTIECGRYNKESRCLEFRIPSLDDFDSLYSISLQDVYKNNYELLKESINEHHLVVLKIRKKSKPYNIDNGDSGNKEFKIIKIIVPSRIAQEPIKYSYSGFNSIMTNGSTLSESTIFNIKIPAELHRPDVKFYLKEKLLHVTYPNVDHTTILIKGFDSIWDTLAYRLGKYKQLILISVITLLLLVLLAFISLFTLDSLGYIEIDDLLGKNDTIVVSTETSDAVASDYETASYPTHSPAFQELNQVLEDQKDAWNYDVIGSVVNKYDSLITINSFSQDDEGYPLYKQLVWLQCRKSLNEANISRLKKLVNKEYPDTVKQSFLREVINGSAAQKTTFARKITKDRKFKTKSFSQIVKMWSEAKQEAASLDSNKNNNSNSNSNSNNNSSNSNNNPSEGYTPPEDI